MSAAPKIVDSYEPLHADLPAAMAWVARKARERTGLNLVAKVEFGRRSDPLSHLAFAAWRQRWWRQPEGRARRIGHYALAASEQAVPNLCSHHLAIMPLGAARGITPTTGRFWEPGEPKIDRWLATLPIFEETAGSLYALELVAWYRDDPLKWWARTGALDVLGEARLAKALCEDLPVRIYRSPQAWNRAGGGGAPGCCILDWDSQAGMECRAFARALVGDDLAHARQLQRMVDKRKPRIRYVLTGQRRSRAKDGI